MSTVSLIDGQYGWRAGIKNMWLKIRLERQEELG